MKGIATLASLFAVASAAAPAPSPRDLAAPPLGEKAYHEFKEGKWEVADNKTCTVEPEAQCKYKSWTLCNATVANATTSTFWCAGPDHKCAEDGTVGCLDEDTEAVALGEEEACEEPDNTCGESFCGTSPVQADCQCVDNECVAVVFVETAGAGAISSSFLVLGAAALASLTVFI
ncbi:hypothetical protein ACHAWF_006568 [Thalassiosira exigua]